MHISRLSQLLACLLACLIVCLLRSSIHRIILHKYKFARWIQQSRLLDAVIVHLSLKSSKFHKLFFLLSHLFYFLAFLDSLFFFFFLLFTKFIYLLFSRKIQFSDRTFNPGKMRIRARSILGLSRILTCRMTCQERPCKRDYLISSRISKYIYIE